MTRGVTSGSAVAIAMLAGTACQALGEGGEEGSRAAILADAAGRKSLLANDYDGGGVLAFRQGDASVALGGLFQARYTANIRDDEGEEEGLTHGFSLPHTRLNASAALNETWSVFVQGEFDSDGGEFGLIDAWADWQLDENWTLRMGQFKVPTTREWQIDPSKQLAAERSVVNEVFGAGRTQGIAGVYADDKFRVVGAFDDGAATANSDFNSMLESDYAFTARGDWLFAGDWSRLDDFQGWRGQEYAGLVGGFVHFQSGGSTGVGSSGATADVDLLQVLVDSQVEGNGWSAYGGVIWRSVDAAGSDTLDSFGVILQGGYFVADADELFARYDVVIPDGDDPGGDTAFNTLTFGWNHFFIPESNASRFTLDLQWFLNETTENGLLGESARVGLLDSGNENQLAFRAQYQATF